MAVSLPHVPLGLVEFRVLRDRVAEHTGMQFDDDALPLFERRLAPRLAKLQLSSFAEYVRHATRGVQGARELECSVELLITGETYFWRQEYQLRAFERELLPALHERQRSRRQLTLWSAGCSTGEEAYTLSILVDRSRLFRGWQTKIYGTDLSNKSIAIAREGVYRESAFRVTPSEIRRTYFARESEGWRVAERTRKPCQFMRGNLLERHGLAAVSQVDVVFCRNVLIYLGDEARAHVISLIFDRLSPGGYLLLGHAESLLNQETGFVPVHLEEDIVYRKPTLQRLTSKDGSL